MRGVGVINNVVLVVVPGNYQELVGGAAIVGAVLEMDNVAEGCRSCLVLKELGAELDGRSGDAYRAGGLLASVLGGDGNGGASCCFGLHLAVFVNGGYGSLVRRPGNLLVGSIVGLDGGVEDSGLANLHGQTGLVKRHSGYCHCAGLYCDGTLGSLASVLGGNGDNGRTGGLGSYFTVFIYGGNRFFVGGPSNLLVGSIVWFDGGLERRALALCEREGGLVQADSGYRYRSGLDGNSTLGSLASVLGGNGDNGRTGSLGRYFTVFIYGGYGSLVGSPGDGLVGGVVRFDCGLKSYIFTHGHGKSGLVESDSCDGDRGTGSGYLNRAGGLLASIGRGGYDGGIAYSLAGDGAVVIDGGDSRVIGSPVDFFVGGVGRLDRSYESLAFSYADGNGRLVKLYAGHGDRGAGRGYLNRAGGLFASVCRGGYDGGGAYTLAGDIALVIDRSDGGVVGSPVDFLVGGVGRLYVGHDGLGLANADGN